LEFNEVGEYNGWEAGSGLVAANGWKTEKFGEKQVVGDTDEGDAVSVRMTVANVHKVLGSVHNMNFGGNKVHGEHEWEQE
jgi:hypothetical protein